MYYFYSTTIALILSFMYEFSGKNYITFINIIESFVLILSILLIISNKEKKYKTPILIASFIIFLLSLCNLIKVRFLLSEITFYDFKLLNAGMGVAELFLDKLPFKDMIYLTVIFSLILIFTYKLEFIYNFIISKFRKKDSPKCERNLKEIIKNFKEKHSYEKLKKDNLKEDNKDEKIKEIDPLNQNEIHIQEAEFVEKENFYPVNENEPSFLEKINSFLTEGKKKLISIIIIILFFLLPIKTFKNTSFVSLILSTKSMVQSYIVNHTSQKTKILKKINKSPLSNVDKTDPLLKAYPYNLSKFENLDIVFIQSETFFDLPKYADKLGKNGIKIYDNEVTKYFNYYQENGISGKILVPTVGGATVNTEYEALTGLAAKSFYEGCIVFTNMLKENTTSIARYMKHENKDTITSAIHNHTKEYWDRNRVYPLLGIDEFYGMYDFTKEQQEDLVGAWMSDKTIFDKTIEVLENPKNKDKPNFIIPVTCQNHGPFLEHKGDYIQVDNLSKKEGWEIQNYISNLKYSDLCLKEFMEYIDSREKPTIVVFYGDHKPDPNYDMFKNSKYFTKNNRENMFLTDYFIYFNKNLLSKDYKLLNLVGIKEDLSAVSINRFIRILLGDDSKLNMYMYNYSKNRENYFGIVNEDLNNVYKEISVNFINRYNDDDYKKFSKYKAK